MFSLIRTRSVRAVAATIARASLAAHARSPASRVQAFPTLAAARHFAKYPSDTPHLSGTSTPYAEEMYRNWQKDPNSVHASWRAFFELEAQGYGEGQAYSRPGTAAASTAAPSGDMTQNILDHIKVERLIRSYETRGHNIAELDPLGIAAVDLNNRVPPELTIEYHGLSNADLDREFLLPPLPLFDETQPTKLKLKDVIKRLEDTYCRHIGYEYMFIQDHEHLEWIRRKAEKPHQAYSPEKKKLILADLIKARAFEVMLQKKFVSEKRFGVDGCEILVPGLLRMLDQGSEMGAEYCVLGMAHRGRLNVLVNVLQKPIEQVFNEFNSIVDFDSECSGDVKYHLGMSSDIVCTNGKNMHLSLMANPSHLEAVNPVVEGKARAEQDARNDTGRKQVVPVLLHGDAAFAGQGVVYETFGLSDLPAYTTGGTIHVIINNQIGFTTDPRFSRSSDYCTDIAKMVGAPIFHVNGDDPEAVVRCFEAAAEWRQKFGRDVVVDVVCYRRFGHNEADQPHFTQPLMYQRIDKHPPITDTYAEKLKHEGVVDQAWIDEQFESYNKACDEAWDRAPNYKAGDQPDLGGRWKGLKSKLDYAKIYNTGVEVDVLKRVGDVISSVPDDFKAHRSIKRILKQRRQSIEEDQGVDWATAEALAFGTLLLEGHNVRLSGQDVERGTFSQRHHVLHDQEVDGSTYVALQHLDEKQGRYSASNSHLSEYGVVGFELGYSMANPWSLVCWEAQFGDFANGAQCVIDQFISAGEAKWRRQSGLVMLLPHGYEGMGPEHSSGRLERFLQLCNDDESHYPEMRHGARTQIQRANMQVANATTPANYFHLLRRQLYRDFRKPLIVMTPKWLLRYPLCKSKLAEMGPGTRFQRFIPEHDEQVINSPENVKRLVLCSGKVYYDLLEMRNNNNLTDVAIGRVEQISPFPFDLVHRHADDFPNAEIVWCQEEPRNMGSWSYVAPRIETALNKSSQHSGQRPIYAGRPPSASVATGDKKAHEAEQQHLLQRALGLL